MNTSRITNRNRNDIQYHRYNEIPDLVHDHFKGIYRTNDDEYDFICEKATDEELDVLALHENMTFSDKRKVITILNKYLKLYQETPKEPRKDPEPPTKEELEAHKMAIASNPTGFLAFLEDKKKMDKMAWNGEDTSWFFNKWNPEGIIPEGLKHYKTKEE